MFFIPSTFPDSPHSLSIQLYAFFLCFSLPEKKNKKTRNKQIQETHIQKDPTKTKIKDAKDQ